MSIEYIYSIDYNVTQSALYCKKYEWNNQNRWLILIRTIRTSLIFMLNIIIHRMILSALNYIKFKHAFIPQITYVQDSI